MNRKDAFGGLILLLFGLLTVVLSFQMSISTFRAPGSGLFPLGLGLLLMLLAGCYLGGLYARRAAQPNPPATEAWVTRGGRLPAFLAAMAAATLLLAPLGFPLTAFLLMVALLKTLDMKGWIAILGLSLGTALASHLLFVQWLQIPLPKGWLGL